MCHVVAWWWWCVCARARAFVRVRACALVRCSTRQSFVWAQDDEFKDAIRAIVTTSPRGRTKRQRHAKANEKGHRREDDVAGAAGSGAQCLVRWKDTWEPAANLSLSCLARWDAEQQERELRTATTTTTTATPRKRGRPKLLKNNKAAGPLRPKAKKNEGRRTRVGKRKREDEDSEEETEEEEEEEEQKHEEREDEHEEEEEEEEERRREYELRAKGWGRRRSWPTILNGCASGSEVG